MGNSHSSSGGVFGPTRRVAHKISKPRTKKLASPVLTGHAAPNTTDATHDAVDEPAPGHDEAKTKAALCGRPKEPKRRSRFRSNPARGLVKTKSRKSSAAAEAPAEPAVTGPINHETVMARSGALATDIWQMRNVAGFGTSGAYNMASYEAKRLLNLVEEVPCAANEQHDASEPAIAVSDKQVAAMEPSRRPQQPDKPPVTRTNSDLTLYTPVRRRSVIQTPGIATRAPSARNSPHTIGGSHPSTPSMSRQQSIESFRRGIHSLPPWLDSGEALPRVATPCNEPFLSIGAFKLGSLRITNGRASPVSPELGKHGAAESAASPDCRPSSVGPSSAPGGEAGFLGELAFSPFVVTPGGGSPALQATSNPSAAVGLLVQDDVQAAFACEEVLHVRLDPSAKPQTGLGIQYADGVDSGCVSVAGPGMASVPASSALSKADSGYSSSVSVRSLRAKVPAQAEAAAPGDVTHKVLAAASIEHDRTVLQVVNITEPRSPVPMRESMHSSEIETKLLASNKLQRLLSSATSTMRPKRNLPAADATQLMRDDTARPVEAGTRLHMAAPPRSRSRDTLRTIMSVGSFEATVAEGVAVNRNVADTGLRTRQQETRREGTPAGTAPSIRRKPVASRGVAQLAGSSSIVFRGQPMLDAELAATTLSAISSSLGNSAYDAALHAWKTTDEAKTHDRTRSLTGTVERWAGMAPGLSFRRSRSVASTLGTRPGSTPWLPEPPWPCAESAGPRKKAQTPTTTARLVTRRPTSAPRPPAMPTPHYAGAATDNRTQASRGTKTVRFESAPTPVSPSSPPPSIPPLNPRRSLHFAPGRPPPHDGKRPNAITSVTRQPVMFSRAPSQPGRFQPSLLASHGPPLRHRASWDDHRRPSYLFRPCPPPPPDRSPSYGHPPGSCRCGSDADPPFLGPSCHEPEPFYQNQSHALYYYDQHVAPHPRPNSAMSRRQERIGILAAPGIHDWADDPSAGRYPRLAATAEPPSRHSCSRSLTAKAAVGGKYPPYRVLHSYNSPAYKGLPIWG